MKANIILSLLLLFAGTSYAQNNKEFFDRLGEKTIESNAYYYRVNEGDNFYKSYYFANDQLYFEGSIAEPSNIESQNTYSGKCKWYYKNGALKEVSIFNEKGEKNGASILYYESGKIWKKFDYKNGKLVNNRYKEFNEDGSFFDVFEDNFNNNLSDWPVYSTENSEANINEGLLVITSKTDKGTSRFLSLSTGSNDYSFEFKILPEDDKSQFKKGMVFGFKDWDNYGYFLIKNEAFYVGKVFEGVNAYTIEGMFDASIQPGKENVLKVISLGSQDVFSINGKVVYKRDKQTLQGANFGFVVANQGTITVDDVVFKEVYQNSTNVNNTDVDVKASGSGLIISEKGYVLTNYHVVQNANSIFIEVKNASGTKNYEAEVVQLDQANDLAILKIKEAGTLPVGKIPFSGVNQTQDIGTSVYTIGYPLALSGMGNEAKFVDGKISSKTGYENALNAYQTSVPVQPGNSGGPLFNSKGELVGIVNAKVSNTDNVSYVIKMSYIKPLFDVLPENLAFPQQSNLQNSSIETQVKTLKPFVVLIKIK